MKNKVKHQRLERRERQRLIDFRKKKEQERREKQDLQMLNDVYPMLRYFIGIDGSLMEYAKKWGNWFTRVNRISFMNTIHRQDLQDFIDDTIGKEKHTIEV